MIIKVRVKPNSKKEGIEQVGENEFLVKVSAKPIKGEANKRLVELLAEYFQIPKSKIRIIRGERSREKLIEIKE